MKHLFLFFIATLIAGQTHATTANRAEMIEQWGYSLTKGICSKDNKSLGSLYEQSMASAAETVLHAGMFNFKPAQNYYHNRGLSGGLKRLMRTDGFHQALTDCYGNNQTEKNVMVWKLLILDEIGTITGGVAGGIVTYYTLFRLMPKIFSRVWPLVTRFTNKKFALAAAVSMIVLPEIYSAWSEDKQQQEDSQTEQSFSDSRLTSIHEMFAILKEEALQQQKSRDAKQASEIKEMATTVISAIDRLQTDQANDTELKKKLSDIKIETEKILKGVQS